MMFSKVIYTPDGEAEITVRVMEADSIDHLRRAVKNAFNNGYLLYAEDARGKAVYDARPKTNAKPEHIHAIHRLKRFGILR
jgi:hypothetical protein